MNSKLLDASLAPELATRPFKFTSRQGRDRRARLLAAARELLRENPPEAVSFADVCQKAEIPRPSAYHFFPDIKAIFLGLRLLHAESVIEAGLQLQEETFATWPQYLFRLVDVGVKATTDEPAFPPLLYGSGPNFSETREIGRSTDARLARLALDGMDRRFVLPVWPERDRVFAVGFAVIDSILRLSFRTEGAITEWMVAEAKRAALAYLRGYLPEFCPARPGAGAGSGPSESRSG